MEKNFIENFNKEFKKMYFAYNKAVSENDYDTAIDIGEKILQGLIKISREYILASMHSESIKSLIEDIIVFHEKNLAYIQGTREAIKSMPVLFTFDAKERAVEILSSSISEFFSFILGALMILADIESVVKNKLPDVKEKSSIPRVM